VCGEVREERKSLRRQRQRFVTAPHALVGPVQTEGAER
jgi:hypothetical protein